MSWLKREATNIELSKKLRELGFPQKAPGWFWYLNIINTIYRLIFIEGFYEKIDKDIEDCIKAYTCSELGEYLLKYIETKDAVYELN